MAKSSAVGSASNNSSIRARGRPKPKGKLNGIDVAGWRSKCMGGILGLWLHLRRSGGESFGVSRTWLLPVEQMVAEVVAGPLVVDDVALDQRIAGRGTRFVAGAQGVIVTTHALAWAENRQIMPVEQAQVLVIANQGAAWCGIGAQYIAAKEGRGVVDIEQAQQGRGQVDLASQSGMFAWLDKTRCVDEQRDMVVGYRQVFGTGAAGGVVGDEDEQGVGKPGFLPRLLKELADGMVGVLDRAFAAIARWDIDTSARVSVGPVVGGGHQLQIERLAGGMVGVGQFQGLVVEVFIGHT